MKRFTSVGSDCVAECQLQHTRRGEAREVNWHPRGPDEMNGGKGGPFSEVGKQFIGNRRESMPRDG